MRKKFEVFREVYHKLSSNLAYMYVYTWGKIIFEMCQLDEMVLQMNQLSLYCPWHKFLIQEALSLNIANMIREAFLRHESVHYSAYTSSKHD